MPPDKRLRSSLVGLAAQLGLTDADLDETIYDLTNQAASDRVNQHGDDRNFEDAFDDEHDAADVEASDINSGGLAAQIGYLIDAVGAAEARIWLQRLAAIDRRQIDPTE